MPTIDLFIVGKERCPFSGLSSLREFKTKFGYAQWDAKTAFQATKDLQQSATAGIAASVATSLESYIQRGLVSVFSQAQIAALEREQPEEAGPKEPVVEGVKEPPTPEEIAERLVEIMQHHSTAWEKANGRRGAMQQVLDIMYFALDRLIMDIKAPS